MCIPIAEPEATNTIIAEFIIGSFVNSKLWKTRGRGNYLIKWLGVDDLDDD